MMARTKNRKMMLNITKLARVGSGDQPEVAQ